MNNFIIYARQANKDVRNTGLGNMYTYFRGCFYEQTTIFYKYPTPDQR